MIRTASMIIALSVIAGCSALGFGGPSTTGPSSDVDRAYERIVFAGKKATERERATCERAGGEVRRDGLAGWEQCIQTLADAGKVCTDSSDCLDRCLVEGMSADFGAPAEGTCSATDSPFGCYQSVEDGVAEPALCVD